MTTTIFEGAGIREGVADELDRLADVFSDPLYRRAAAALRGKAPGRHPVGDDEALADMAMMLRADPSLSPQEAARLVAIDRPTNGAGLESVTRRLARKYRARRGMK